MIFQVDNSDTFTVRRGKTVVGEISRKRATFTARPSVDLTLVEMETITLFMSSTTEVKA